MRALLPLVLLFGCAAELSSTAGDAAPEPISDVGVGPEAAAPPPDAAPLSDAAPPPLDAAPLSDAAPPPDAALPDCAPAPIPAQQGGRIAAVTAVAGEPLVVDTFADAPLVHIGLSGEGPAGPVTFDFEGVEGGPPWRWRFRGPVAEPGTYCLIFSADMGATAIVSAAFPVAGAVEPPPDPPGDDLVFKVTRNHQWTCEENNHGIELHVYVRDANGFGLPNVPVRIEHSGNDRYEDGRFEDYPVPPRLITDGEGFARLERGNRWPVGEREDGSIDFFVLSLSVEGAPSDRAIELTTGFWETNEDVVGAGQACKYCPGVENVWGHWSYTVEFTRQLGPTEVCDVPTDHAGMSRCAVPQHVGHDPAEVTCRPL